MNEKTAERKFAEEAISEMIGHTPTFVDVPAHLNIIKTRQKMNDISQDKYNKKFGFSILDNQIFMYVRN